MQIDGLTKIVSNEAAIRRCLRLQPVGGQGDKIFPPTYPGEGRNNPPPRHVFERRRIDGREVWCVLVDSVQSQANRLEESLRQLIDSGTVIIPHLVVDFSGKQLAGIDKITSLDAPHRVYDAIFRDSLLDSQPFMKSAEGMSIAKASTSDASALLQLSPTALLFGAWHSTGEGGGLGAKFARCLVSEIVAVDVPVNLRAVDRKDSSYLVASGESLQTVEPVSAGRRTGSRIDPLGILRRVEVFKGPSGWDVSEDKAGKSAKKVRPSEINHGNIAPSVAELGITCDHLDHRFVLSFAALRRLRFGSDQQKNAAGRALLAALGLLASIEQQAQGYALRSRCDLVVEGSTGMEIVKPDGSVDLLSFSVAEARDLYNQAFKKAKEAGFAFREKPLQLEPQNKLVEIVKQSQNLALEGQGGDDESSETKS